jgi:two-component system response regulator RpfG
MTSHHANNEKPFDTEREGEHVVIIDDQATGRAILESIVKKISPDIICKSFADPLEALNLCKQRPPDLLITDYRMPVMDGIEVIRKFRNLNGCREVPVVVVTIIEDRDVKYTALEAGATDFLARPFDHYECQARCRNLLHLYKHQKATRNRAFALEQQVDRATQDIRNREADALICLARAGEYRDEGTGNHIFRMAHYSLELARGLGLGKEDCERIERASPMHDIGKIGIPDNILLKPGKLSHSEREIMETHTIIGHDILGGSASSYLKLGAKIALSHHERFDGTGYPYGLRGSDIPIEARIVAVADTLDALTTVRPYKSAWSMEESLKHIKHGAGTHFDPDCVKTLLSREDVIRSIFNDLPDVPD